MQETPTSLTMTLKRHDGELVVIQWKDIENVTAFKQDLFNPQIIILEIGTVNGTWEVDAADCEGFAVLTHVLSQHLPDVVPYDRWWPIATNPVRLHESVDIYRRVHA